MKKNNIFILAIAMAIVSLGLVACEGGAIAPDVKSISSVRSVTLRNGSADAGADIEKTSTDAAFILTADVVVTGGAPTMVRWTSSDPSVATVSTNGEVTMVGAGRTTVMAVSTHDTSKTDSVILIVEVPQSVRSVTLRNGNADAGASIVKQTRDASFSLTADVVVQGGASTTVRWTSSDTTVATVSTTGEVAIVAAGITVIRATSTRDATKTDSIYIVVDIYVGADNIGDTSANIRFSSLKNSTVVAFNVVTYKVYTNATKVTSLAEAEVGHLMGTANDVNNQAITGLTDKSVYYVSVVAEGSNGDKVYLGSYGFVTGATLYWDATVPQIAGETAGKWKDISSSTIDYDGNMPNTASISDGYYTNSTNNNGTTFTRITTLRAIFLDASIGHPGSLIIGNTGATADAYHYWTDVKSSRIIGDGAFPSTNVTSGIFHTDGVKVTLATFVKRYNIRTAYSILTTGNTHASQTRDREFTGYNWAHGGFYRLVLFTDALTEAQGLAINSFLVNSK